VSPVHPLQGVNSVRVVRGPYTGRILRLTSKQIVDGRIQVDAKDAKGQYVILDRGTWKPL
jgi:hypothetical protein